MEQIIIIKKNSKSGLYVSKKKSFKSTNTIRISNLIVYRTNEKRYKALLYIYIYICITKNKKKSQKLLISL